MVYLYLAIGGVAGTLARYGLTGWVHSWAGTRLPWGTFAVNVLGSFLLGYLVRAFQLAPISLEMRTLLTVGFCGAFTTFSTFSYETLILFQEGAWLRAALYAFGSLGFGLAAMFAGIALATGTLRLGG
jgi:fluoride exporter